MQKYISFVGALIVGSGASLGACSSSQPGAGAEQPAPAATSPSSPPPASGSDAATEPPPPPPAGTDSDTDGISDELEAKYAAEYMPFISIHPSDACKTQGIAYRIAPHPSEPKRVMMWADILYDQDCGANGHAGDDETFGVVIDPTRPGPAGILAVRAISHQNTPCQQITTCGSCPGMTACATAQRNGAAYPVVFPSKDKHGNYVVKATCDTSVICDFGGCALAPQSAASSAVNVGEPGHPLVRDLTTEGFITTANGFQKNELMHFDPWKAGKFGGAGDVSNDLVDPAFVVDTTACK